MKFKKHGFTLTEIMIVITLLGIIAGFAIPSYAKAMRRAHERDMIAQLIMVHGANKIYDASEGTYWNPGAAQNRTQINTALGLSIISNDGTTYEYTSTDGTDFLVKAFWNVYTIQIDQTDIDGTNPSCSPPGNCLSVP